MSDYSLPRIKESELPEATSIDKVRVLDNAGNSVWVEKENFSLPASQISVSSESVEATTVDTAIDELSLDIQNFDESKENVSNKSQDINESPEDSQAYPSNPAVKNYVDTADALKADKATQIIAGAGLTGGGDLSENRTIKLDIVNDLVTTSATRPVSATQAKKLQDEITQLAGEVSLFKEESNLKDAVQDSKIKDIESIISTMNPNQSAQLSVSGRKTISLPKNAANGGMSVKLEGLTAENYLPNGDFRDGINGWLNTNFDVVQGDGVLLQKNNNQKARFRQGGVANINATDIYYSYAIIQCSVSPPATGIIFGQTNVALDVNPGFHIYASQNTNVQRLSLKGNIDLSGNYHILGLSATEDYQGDIKIKHMSIINLTETFGAGNEPTVEECDKIFGGYFEGVKSFEPTGRVRSVGKNLLNPLYVKANFNVSPESGNYIINTKAYSTLLIKVKPNTWYIIGGISSTATSFAAYYDVDGNYISRTGASKVSSRNLLTPTNCYFVNLTCYNFATESEMLSDYYAHYDRMIMSESLSSIPYEPYKETTLYLTAPELRSNDTVKDEIRKGANGYELVKRISEVDGTVLTTPEIIPISYGGVLNSAESGTVYHEPVIADAGVYDTKMDILLTDYPITSIEEIIKHENGVDTYLNVASAVIASDGLSFTHPDLADGDLVLFTYAFDKESTNGNITATFYDSNVVKIDTETGTAYRINEVVTNGELIRTITEVQL